MLRKKKNIHEIAQENTSPNKSHGAELQQVRGASELGKWEICLNKIGSGNNDIVGIKMGIGNVTCMTTLCPTTTTRSCKRKNRRWYENPCDSQTLVFPLPVVLGRPFHFPNPLPLVPAVL